MPDMIAERHILHVDMDAFYAAVEQLDHPELRGKPALVGGDPKGRGVISAASYEARRFGCSSAMPMSRALRLSPGAVVMPPRMTRYAEISLQVFEIIEHFTPLAEPISIDEAFLDVSGSVRLFDPPQQIAKEVKRHIRAATQLSASIGLAPNKFLAKLASELNKPDGLVVVKPDEVQAFLGPLPVSRLWGVGKATLPRFEEMGISTIGNLCRLSEFELRSRFGEGGDHYHRLAQGIENRPVMPDREAKSISHEVTFTVDTNDDEYLRAA